MRARDNPFAVDRVLRIRYRLAEDEWAALLARLQDLDYRAALVGPHGSGKTTLLKDLAPRLEARGFNIHWLRLRAESRQLPKESWRTLFPSLGNRDLILFDGAEQLPPLQWRRFRHATREAGGLIITTHRAGRLPTLIECRTSPGLLAAITTDLLGQNSLSYDFIENLYNKHRGNLRDALRELYDRFADEEGVGC